MANAEWKVFFEGSLWGHRGRDHAGREIPVNKEFSWAGCTWLVPYVYSCGKGLVMDLCCRVPKQRIQAWMDKWNLSPENGDLRSFTRDQQLMIDAENPLDIEKRPTVIVNGMALDSARGSGMCWNPCIPHGDEDTKPVMEHYGLDPRDGWIISRHHFPWKTKKRPELKSLGLTMRQTKVSLPGEHFRITCPGDRVSLVHPVTGKTCVLTVEEIEAKQVPGTHFEQFPGMEFPTHFQVMSFTVEPETELTVLDCAESDRPRPDFNGSFGIIGGASGPTALCTKDLHVACSAVHFEPVNDVEWRTVFYDKNVEDLTVELF